MLHLFKNVLEGHVDRQGSAKFSSRSEKPEPHVLRNLQEVQMKAGNPVLG